MYESLTAFTPTPDGSGNHGEAIVDGKHKGTPDDPIQWPFVAYASSVIELEQALYTFHDQHPDFELTRYRDILERNGLSWDMRSMTEADVSTLDGQAVMALLMGAVRAERFCDGTLIDFCESGCIAKWLYRLREIDDQES